MLKSNVKNIYLIGAMGVGKTTIGKQLALTTGIPFKDSDLEIETATGASIPLIFEVEGEAGFRKRETEMIAKLTQETPLILATGGGVILAKPNRQHLIKQGMVIYLRASLNELLERTRHHKNRPLLQTENPRARFQKILTEREPLYLETADWVLDTENKSVKMIVHEIIQYTRT